MCPRHLASAARVCHSHLFSPIDSTASRPQAQWTIGRHTSTPPRSTSNHLHGRSSRLALFRLHRTRHSTPRLEPRHDPIRSSNADHSTSPKRLRPSERTAERTATSLRRRHMPSKLRPLLGREHCARKRQDGQEQGAWDPADALAELEAEKNTTYAGTKVCGETSRTSNSWQLHLRPIRRRPSRLEVCACKRASCSCRSNSRACWSKSRSCPACHHGRYFFP